MSEAAVRTAGPAGHTELLFQTSGSTGAARRWVRRAEQMEREVELIQGCLIGPVDHVVTYAPPQHLFGALFGRWLPRMSQVCVHQAWRDPLGPLSVPPGARVLIVCIPTAWGLLQRNLRALRHADSVVALHSSAAVPPIAQQLVGREELPLRAYELLGSTETGGIAHRPVAPEGAEAVPWQVFPDVSVVRDGEASTGAPAVAELVVAGPRLARPEGRSRPPARWATGDLVEYTGERSFRLIGRASSLIKVNGVRVHLDRVDERLNAALARAQCAVLPVPDPFSGEGYAVFWAGRRHGVDTADIRAALRDFPSPSRIVELPAVPRTAGGKPDRAALLAMLEAGVPYRAGATSPPPCSG